MQKRRRLERLTLHAVTLLCALPGSAGGQVAQPAARSLSELGLAVFRGVSTATSEANVVFSPVSVGLAVALLAEGSRAETRDEILQALGVEADAWGSFEEALQGFLTDLERDTTAVSRIATSLWVDEGRTLDGDFRSRAELYHQATVAEVDLQDPQTRTTVDGWVRDRTEGRISRIMPDQVRDVGLLLLNAVYFKGLWAEPFDPRSTRPLPFVLATGDSIPVPMMGAAETYDYFETEEASGVRLPYRGGRFAAYVVLPGASSSLAALEGSLTVALVETWERAAARTWMSILVPRFEHRGRWDLRGPLREAGIQRALSPSTSQLDALWEAPGPPGPTFVGDATQATFIRFDEEGTEAAAATSMSIVPTSVPPEFRVDRPFLLVIRDEASGALLFVAKIGDPTDAGG